VRAVAIGYALTLSGLTTIPDQVPQRANPHATEVGGWVEHITAAVGQFWGWISSLPPLRYA